MWQQGVKHELNAAAFQDPTLSLAVSQKHCCESVPPDSSVQTGGWMSLPKCTHELMKGHVDSETCPFLRVTELVRLSRNTPESRQLWKGPVRISTSAWKRFRLCRDRYKIASVPSRASAFRPPAPGNTDLLSGRHVGRTADIRYVIGHRRMWLVLDDSFLNSRFYALGLIKKIIPNLWWSPRDEKWFSEHKIPPLSMCTFVIFRQKGLKSQEYFLVGHKKSWFYPSESLLNLTFQNIYIYKYVSQRSTKQDQSREKRAVNL